MWWADQKATAAGWTPRWYGTYRFWLTAVVGTSILVSLGSATLLSPGPNRLTTTGTKLKAIEGEKYVELAFDLAVQVLTCQIRNAFETVDGAMKVEKADDAFVKFTNMERVRLVSLAGDLQRT